MKTNLHELFDGAKPEELEPFSDALDAPDLPPETLSSVKEKVYAKTGLKPGRKRYKNIWFRFGALAACFALVVSAIVLIPVWRKVPVWENAQYTAEEIAELFELYKDNAASTNAYTKIYVPDAKYLYIGSLPEDDYLGVYQYRAKRKSLDREEFEAFFEGILPKLATAVNMDLPPCEIEEEDSYEKWLRIYEYIGPYTMVVEQMETHHWFHLSTRTEYDNRKITLAGEPVQIDQRLSDEEIISALQPIKDILFDLFDVSFPDIKILRSFDSYSEYGADWIEIYFYDEDAHALNRTQERPVTDYISLSFDNMENYADDILSDGVLTVAMINYYQNRVDISKAYALTANAKKISLKDAEVLLYNGYVFGGHSCPLCMAAQDKVSFEGYDFVDLEYVFGYDYEHDRWTTGLPFYAFYKKIGSSENGNSEYAKTYVPAIEVSGLEEYFQSQKSNHKTGGFGWYLDPP